MFVKHMRLGKKPEVRTTTNGVKMASASAAYDTFLRKENGKDVYATTWVQIVAFGVNADRLEKFGKPGTYFKFSGEIHTEEYPKKDGSGTGMALRMRETVVQFPEIRFSRSTDEQNSSNRNDTPNASSSAPANSESTFDFDAADDTSDSTKAFEEFFSE